jgi:hypothetical protein
MKKLMLVSAVVLASIGSAAAQSLSPDRLPTASAVAANRAALETCEAQLQRLAGLNKTLAANYDVEHAREVCLAEQ